MQIDMSAA